MTIQLYKFRKRLTDIRKAFSEFETTALIRPDIGSNNGEGLFRRTAQTAKR